MFLKYVFLSSGLIVIGGFISEMYISNWNKIPLKKLSLLKTIIIARIVFMKNALKFSKNLFMDYFKYSNSMSKFDK